MTEFDHIKLRRLDLTLLLVFLGLMRHRKAAAVADELGLTQSTISHALGRLRDAFGDELFLRRPHGMEPTAGATAIAPEIERAVAALGVALEGGAPFEPATTGATLRLSALDYEIATLFPDFLSRLCRAAPGLRVTVRTLARDAAIEALDAGRVDLALGYLWDPPSGLIVEPLIEDGYLLVARAGHPLLGDPSLSGFLAARHIVVSPQGTASGIVDRVLAREGQARTVVASVPEFLPALALLSRSDLVATVPERLARQYAATFRLGTAPPPLAIRTFTSAAVRHRRDASNPLVTWALGELKAAVSGQAG